MGEEDKVRCELCGRIQQEGEEFQTRETIEGSTKLLCAYCEDFDAIQVSIRDFGPDAFGSNRVQAGVTVIVEVLNQDLEYEDIKNMIEKDRRMILGFMRGPGTFYHTAIPKTD